MFCQLLLLVAVGLVATENGLDAWLRYARLPDAHRWHDHLLSEIVVLNSTTTSPVYTAGQDLQKGLAGIFGKKIDIHSLECKDSSESVVVGTIEQYTNACSHKGDLPELEDDGFWLNVIHHKGVQFIGQNE